MNFLVSKYLYVKANSKEKQSNSFKLYTLFSVYYNFVNFEDTIGIKYANSSNL